MAANMHSQEPLKSPAVTALRQEALGSEMQRTKMERSLSEDFRMERDDLKEAAAHSQNVILDLGLDGIVRFVSPSWQDLIGTVPSEVQGKPISEVLPEDCRSAFQESVEALQKDDSKSRIIRFSLPLGPHSLLRRKLQRSKSDLVELDEEAAAAPPVAEEEPTMNLEAQGIMIYLTTGEASHVSHIRYVNCIRTLITIRPCG
jgi:serine/threonine-protein kinase RIM15